MRGGHQVAHFSLTYDHRQTPCPAQHYTAWSDIRNWFGAPSWWDNRYTWNLAKILYNLVAPGRLAKVIRDFKPDVVHFHCVQEMATARLFQVPHRLGVPAVMTYHYAGFDICPTGALMQGNTALCDGICSKEPNPGESCHTYQCISSPVRRFLRVPEFRRMVRRQVIPNSMDMVITPSRAMTEQVVRAGHLPAERVRHIYNPVPHTLWTSQPSWDAPPPPPESRYMLAVGRLDIYKGFTTLVRAFHQMPDIPLVIVGQGPYLPELTQYIQENRLTHITLAGWKTGEELWDYYRKCTGVIVPSEWFEALGYVVVEGFAHGKPVVATQIGGITDLVREGETGLLFSLGDLEGMKTQVRRLWENPDLASTLGRNGYHLYKQCFQPEKIYREMVEVYEQARLNRANSSSQDG